MKKFLLTIFFLLFFFHTHQVLFASPTNGTIDATYHRATNINSFFTLPNFSSQYGRIDFITTAGTPIHITNTTVTGDAWGEGMGWIRFDPSVPFVGVSNDVNGALSGYAWGENAGQINFNSGSFGLGVTINASGEFNGYAWSENFGWIKFDCSANDVDYCVKTDWRPSSAIFQCNDTLDNDSDGLIDYPADPGCDNATDNLEYTGGCSNCLDVCPDDTIPPIDPATVGIQSSMPTGYGIVGGQCVPINIDACPDDTIPPIDPITIGNQTSLPLGYIVAGGQCIPDDEIACSDGIDNDFDGRTDWPLDPGCDSNIDADETSKCADGIENDIPSDGKIDYPADPGCQGKWDNDESNTTIQCSDGIDNDSDGKADYPLDPGCSSASDTNEISKCADGLENDVPPDGKIDYPADPGCQDKADNDEYNNPNDFCPDNNAYPPTIGIQQSLPAGFVKLANGQCVPVTVDVCPDDTVPPIDQVTVGVQSSMPAGYGIVGGKCVPLPDVCPDNLLYPPTVGNQSSVPSGFTKNSNGECVPVSTDVCPDDTIPPIDQVTIGNQLTMPSGYNIVAGQCVPNTQITHECNDGLDNDGDGDIDYPSDEQCESAIDDSESEVHTLCEDFPTDPSCLPNCTTDPTLPGCTPNPCDDPTAAGCNCYVPAGVDPSLWDTVKCIVKETIDKTKTTIGDTIIKISNVSKNPAGNVLTKSIAIVGLAFGTVFTLLPYLFGTSLSFTEIILIPYRIWSLILSILGLRKRVRPWGTVYDSITKQPLDPVIVDLFRDSGEKVETSITDIDGRYGFLVAPGRYWIRPRKTHYAFPSMKLVGKTRDEIYLDLYFGTMFDVTEQGQVITKNIPMDPEHFDWNEFAKRDQKLMRFYSKRDVFINRIADVFFTIGFFIAIIAAISAPILYNLVILGIYIVVLILRETGVRQRVFGRITSRDGTPYSFAVMRVYTEAGHVEVARRVSNQYGKYYCLMQNGHYTLTIEKKNPDESYTVIYTSPAFEVTRGVINTRFKI